MGAAALPYLATAVAAAGTVASMSASQRAERDRKGALVQGIEDEAKIQDKANATTQDFVKENFDPSNRTANYEAQATDRESALGSLLARQSESGRGDVTAATTGNLSDTYTRAKADAAATSTQKARNLSRLLSRSGAASGLFGQDALNGADYASDMLGLRVDSKLGAGRANAKFGAAGASGNNLALLGGLLSGAGRAAGGVGGGYAGTQAPAPVEVRGTL